MKNPKQTRMCVLCRVRLPQGELLRFQKQDERVVAFSGVGRSFYICENCRANANEAKARGILSKILGISKDKINPKEIYG